MRYSVEAMFYDDRHQTRTFATMRELYCWWLGLRSSDDFCVLAWVCINGKRVRSYA